MKNAHRLVAGAALALLSVLLVAACMQPLPPYPPTPAAPAPLVSLVDAGVQTDATAPVAAPVPPTSASVAPAAAPPQDQRPPYRAGDFRLFYPSGALTIGTPATEDGGAGGVARYHDGQENVCMQGCVSIARTAVQTAAQSRSGTFSDEAAWQHDVLACIKWSCIDKKGATWPPETR